MPRNATVTQEDFLQILLTQLRFQDPLKPVDNQQFVAQLAQFSALEINRQQSEKIDTLLQINATRPGHRPARPAGRGQLDRVPGCR